MVIGISRMVKSENVVVEFWCVLKNNTKMSMLGKKCVCMAVAVAVCYVTKSWLYRIFANSGCETRGLLLTLLGKPMYASATWVFFLWLGLFQALVYLFSYKGCLKIRKIWHFKVLLTTMIGTRKEEIRGNTKSNSQEQSKSWSGDYTCMVSLCKLLLPGVWITHFSLHG